VAESFFVHLIAERRMLLSVIFFVMGPGVSKVLEIGTIPVLLKTVVGFEISEMPPEIMEPEVSFHRCCCIISYCSTLELEPPVS
jgi:hypothetical protein